LLPAAAWRKRVGSRQPVVHVMRHDLDAEIGLPFEPPHPRFEIVHTLHHAVFERVVAFLAEEVAERRLQNGGLGRLVLEGDVLQHGKELGIEAKVDTGLHAPPAKSTGRTSNLEPTIQISRSTHRSTLDSTSPC